MHPSAGHERDLGTAEGALDEICHIFSASYGTARAKERDDG
jgi:hypothetical protein